MEQYLEKKTLGLVGSGRLATHLNYYLIESGYNIKRWSRSLSPITVAETLKGCDAILLAISDDAIESFVKDNSLLDGPPLIHFSGSKSVPGVTGFHPLMTFTEKLFPLDFYPSIPFVCEAGGVSFVKIFSLLKNPVETIDPNKKSLYHALCVLSGNFTALLWAKTERAFSEDLGLNPSVLVPYRVKQFNNINDSPLNALTGPLVRDDIGTIDANLKALEGDPYHEVYTAFLHAYQKEKSVMHTVNNSTQIDTLIKDKQEKESENE